MSEVRERSILFSSDMVRAILDGRKTQTRRLATRIGYDSFEATNGQSVPAFIFPNGSCPVEHNLHLGPFGLPGDRLWVRETFTVNNDGARFYKATHRLPKDRRWIPSIHMPKEYSRIKLEIISIRVERLNEISEEDAEAEGALYWWRSLSLSQQAKIYNGGNGPIAAFQMLWESINGKGSWEKSPWVWVLTFRKI